MPQPNFCVQCGAQIARSRWRVWRSQFCARCAARFGRQRVVRFAAAGIAFLLTGFAAGRYLRPSPPPLIIERRANSPLSDLPASPNDLPRKPGRNSRTGESDSSSAAQVAAEPDDAVYICGARTKKGTPCRRRVHSAGERCYQHKGRPAMVSLEKLMAKDR
jgi:hypothetical protein